jgi:hypothetical protein
MENPEYDMTNSVMSGWIQTYTGRKVYPLALTPEQIDLEDIAHALSMKCRFTGHCDRFYSVAQHSVLVATRIAKNNPELMRDALMHDAAEYILPDVASPIKPYLPGFKELEHHVEKIIALRFGLTFPRNPLIKHWDNVMVVTERQWFMKQVPGLEWDVPAEPLKNYTIESWTPEVTEKIFLHFAKELGIW